MKGVKHNLGGKTEIDGQTIGEIQIDKKLFLGSKCKELRRFINSETSIALKFLDCLRKIGFCCFDNSNGFANVPLNHHLHRHVLYKSRYAITLFSEISDMFILANDQLLFALQGYFAL